MKNAWMDINEQLAEHEYVVGICFGAYGWSSLPSDLETADYSDLGWGEEDIPNPIPWDMRRKVLSVEEAMPLMQGWSFSGGYGAPECYATYIWTNKRVFWVTQYDGSTSLNSVPRNPEGCAPNMPGG
jgi:hypothetical protein